MSQTLTTRTLAAAAIVAAAGFAFQAQAQDAKPTVEKCFGIAAKGHNDCAAGAHSCAGQASRDRDPASFVALPVGACGKIAGGSLKAS